MNRKFTEYKTLNLPNIANEELRYWKENNVFEKSITTRPKDKPFVFFEGPPSANGLPGIHHVMARAIKDIFCRYKTLKGYRVNRKAGWDTHGLPIELGVEKELGITKEDIGTKITVEQYNKACKEAVMRYTDIWNNLTEKMGYWVDMKDPYITYKPKYMESVWWLLKQIYNKNLLYKGYTIQPYSPKAGTGLSSHELNQPGCYKDVTDTTVVAQFALLKTKENTKAFCNAFGIEKEQTKNASFLAWTTTPWTLPSNTALTVGKNIKYALIKTYNQYTFKPIKVVLATDLIEKQFSGKYAQTQDQSKLKSYKKEDKKIPFLVIATCTGADLSGIKYEQLLPYCLPYENEQNAFKVILGDFVTTEDGTGIVHTAPTFGADDALVAKQANVPPMLVLDENKNPVPLVDLQGRFRKEVEEFAGMYVKNEYYDKGKAPKKSVDVQIAIKLKIENKAFRVEKYKHNYPHCWRTDKPILYYPLDSWFIKITEVKDKMFSLNQTINWKPKATGEGRFGNWLKNANDWNLSRSRFWGIPLPIWRTEDGEEQICIGSVEELKKEMKRAVDAKIMEKDIFPDFKTGNMSDENYDKIDLHKNIVDKIVLVSKTGKPMYRENDLIDVWFDSGSMPYAQWHYPFEKPFPLNKNLGEGLLQEEKTAEANASKKDLNGVFPADFIAEGVDQTRGWFYTLHAIATMVFDSVAYKNVVSNGLVLDKEGQKMSKRLGNAIDPFETLAKHGADATRWYMISNANPWDNLKFDIAGIEEVKRKFFGTLYNTYSFFSLYANIDNFKYSECDIPLAERPEIDRWILSELHTLIKKVDSSYSNYEPTKATRLIDSFVQDYLSNWYVRLCRRRFWKGEYGKDKISAYQTLYTCMIVVAKLASPVAPFFMDRLYRDLTQTTQKSNFESVHLTDFPKENQKMIDKSLERKMENAQIISSLVLSLRAKEKIKVRQPLQKIIIPVLNKEQEEEISEVSDLIKSEVNVKEIELLNDKSSDILVKQIKPNFKTLGPKFGKDMKLVASKISELTSEDIATIEKEEKLTISINQKNISLELSDVEITSKDIEGWLVANSGGITVALDITITEPLRNEGIARELVNRIQNARKDSGLEVTDKIKLTIKRFGSLEKAISENSKYVMNETLTKQLVFSDTLKNGMNIDFGDIKSKILIEKVKQ